MNSLRRRTITSCFAFEQDGKRKIDAGEEHGDQVFIEGDPFVLEPNLDICAATNARGVKFRVAGGTGGHAGATGQGRFDIYSNLTPCNGMVVAAHVSFEGLIKVPN